MYAVIFYSTLNTPNNVDYSKMAQEMELLASKQPGFISIHSVRDTTGKGITISYWKDLESIKQWKSHPRHQVAQSLGKTNFYTNYTVQICRLEREYTSKL